MDCMDAIYSNDYYDFIVQHDNIQVIPESEPCVQNVNERYFILHRNRQQYPELMEEFEYLTVPRCFTTLDVAAMEASGIFRIQNLPTLALKGQGVLIGMIDTGIDYQNPLFRNNDGTSRIAAIWDQTIRDGPPPEDFSYGTEYRTEQINEALASGAPLEVVPSGDNDGHGTYIASLAAGGSSPIDQFTGAAPHARIAMVKLKEAKEYLREFFFIRRGAVVFQENDIMAGLQYLHHLAYELHKPLVVCFCLGTNMGRHDRSSALPWMFDNISARRMRAAVIASGNEANKRHHFYGTILELGEFENVEINVGDHVGGFMAEIWGHVPDLFSVEIISPTGERAVSIPGYNIDYTFLFENTRVRVDYHSSVAANGAQLILIRFFRPTRGIWNVRVYFESGLHGIFHMWLPMSGMLDGEVFFLLSNPDVTITLPGTASIPITVGGYNPRDGSIFLDSGRGYTMDGIIKPELVAPAVDVLGAGMRNRLTTKSGTSASAAITAGAVALLMEWAIVRGNFTSITSSDIKTILIRGARRDTNRLYPNREWGYGRLDLYEAFNNMRNI